MSESSLPATDIEKRLNLVAQQHIISNLRVVERKLRSHDTELMLLTLVVVACVFSVAYNEHNINKWRKENGMGCASHTGH